MWIKVKNRFDMWRWQTDMNLNERLEQCRKDKAAIEKEEQELLNQIKKEKKIPIISFVDFGKSKNRVVINLTPTMLNAIKYHPIIKQLVIDTNGNVANFREDYQLDSVYDNQQPIFGTFKPNSD